MVKIGLAGWGEHKAFYERIGGVVASAKLKTYSAHFPVVEIDSSFYAILPEKNYIKWVGETPPNFKFIIKVVQGMTGHDRISRSAAETLAMFAAFKASIQPVIAAGKVGAVLFQYPPWFDCTKANVDVLRYAKAQMEGLPLALEFRNQSWFAPEMAEKTLAFMEREGWIHSICDEPQAGVGSIPTVLQTTDREMTVVRFHGRNIAGWNQTGGSRGVQKNSEEQPSWREVRYLYDYSQTELLEWQVKLKQLQQTTKDICVIFNNNSGGHAAGNAMKLMELLGLADPSANEKDWPQQLDLF